VGGRNPLNLQTSERFNRSRHPIWTGGEQVHSAQNSVNRPAMGDVLDVLERVHHTCMGATQQDHQSVRTLKE
jgi:hypothetical protein